MALVFAPAAAPVSAAGDDRTLWLHHTHTGKTGKFTFKRNGRYDPSVLREMNIFLADWRTGSVTDMDPALFDLMWEVHREVGGNQPYHIVSSYRDPRTNAMLRTKSSGVAENSQHMRGKAMDVFIPGIKLSALRTATMRRQVGGVGYYPTSGSPFVHMDTGSVRAWPRMTRAQLLAVFPDGRTLHLPPDSKPLSASGQQYASAEWKKCRQVPCKGQRPTLTAAPELVVAAIEPPPPSRRVTLQPVAAPAPPVRAAALARPVATAPRPQTKPLAIALAASLPTVTALDALAALQPPRPLPARPRDAAVLTAYAPDIVPEPGALHALKTLLARGGAVPSTPRAQAQNIFDATWAAVASVKAQAPVMPSRRSIKGLAAREVVLVAPEVEHVFETVGGAMPLTSLHFAEFYPPEGDFSAAAQLGPLANQMVFEPSEGAVPRYDAFKKREPLLVAWR